MEHRPLRGLVGLDQRKGWARHMFRDAQIPQDRARQRGFTRSQLAFERNRAARPQSCGNPRGQPAGRRQVGKREVPEKSLDSVCHNSVLA